MKKLLALVVLATAYGQTVHVVGIGATNAPNIVEPFTAGTGGVTLNQCVKLDGSTPENVVANTASDHGCYGIAQATISAGGAVLVTRLGQATAIADGAITQGDILVASATTGGYVHDSGTANPASISAGTQTVGVALASAPGSGSTLLVTLAPATAGSSGGGTGNAGVLHTVTFSTTPAFTCGSATAGTVDTFELSTSLTANISPTLSGCTSGQTINFRFTQDATGGRTVTWPTGWTGLCQASPVASAITTITAVWDGTTATGACTGNGTPPVVVLQTAPSSAPPSGFTFEWCDSTSKICREEDSSGVIYAMSKELSSGNIRVAGGANGVDSAATAHNTATIRACATAGTANAQTCTTTPSFAPAAGDEIIVIPGTGLTNTGAMTLNVNSSSAAAVMKWGGSAAMASGDLVAGKPFTMTFDGTNWDVNDIGNAPSGGGGPVSSCAGNTVGVLYECAMTLSQANITGMFGAAVTLISAPGAGKMIRFEDGLFNQLYVASYSGGGNLSFGYNMNAGATSGAQIGYLNAGLFNGTYAFNTIGEATGCSLNGYGVCATGLHSTDFINQPITISNQTAAFTCSTTCGTVAVDIFYRVSLAQ